MSNYVKLIEELNNLGNNIKNECKLINDEKEVCVNFVNLFGLLKDKYYSDNKDLNGLNLLNIIDDLDIEDLSNLSISKVNHKEYRGLQLFSNFVDLWCKDEEDNNLLLTLYFIMNINIINNLEFDEREKLNYIKLQSMLYYMIYTNKIIL